jgi:predicted acyl esterase
MNDGVVLPADIVRPVEDKRHPVIVVPVRLATSGRSRISRRGLSPTHRLPVKG